MKLLRSIIVLLFLQVFHSSFAQRGDYESFQKENHQVTFETTTGYKLRVSFYQDDVIRFHWVSAGEDYFADDRYEMVVDHEKNGNYSLKEQASEILLINDKLTVAISKSPLKVDIRDSEKMLLEEREGVKWEDNRISIDFEFDEEEHFAGLGHGAFGWVESIDLRGQKVSSNYGEGKMKSDWGAQGVLTVPYYLSSKGYGVFLNSTYNHEFNFGKNQTYDFGFNTSGFPGQMDYFFIYGPHFREILGKYTGLTGRPRLPQRSIFGLQLSDKGSPQHQGVEWWKEKIIAHRNAGYPLDHLVNDNRWRAGTGAWSGSWFEWDSTRVPDPAEFNEWIKAHHLTVTLDHNRNNALLSAGWKPEYNLPYAKESGVKEGESAPDYSNPEMRNWIWELFWSQSLNPDLNYPGDALWIDETDEMWPMSDTIILANGRSWAENENYYPFLIGKAIVQEGWDNKNENLPPGIGEDKRPFVWARSAMAGGQRLTTHWTGDIKCDYEWMKAQVRAMQASGLSGFPYFNHDAGGFREPGPEDHMYMNWAMAFGSFSPIWRPHGPGENSRWPLDRSQKARDVAMKYGVLRYEMMPYIYTYAHIAHEKGVPMARAMVIDHQEVPEAWKYDLQYMWGDELLVAPVFSKMDSIREVWLPEGKWYDFHTREKIIGGKTIRYKTTTGQLPLFVKEGAIIPKYDYAKSTFSLDPTKISIDVYTGTDGAFTLYEDDNVTERFRTRNELRTTEIEFKDGRLTIYPSIGTYEKAPMKRDYMIVLIGLKNIRKIKVNSKNLDSVDSVEMLEKEEGIFWDGTHNKLIISLKDRGVNERITVE
ncbi:glycoside hydrolase family 31 protein [Gramella jeungdoensis]|uniref:Glycoside hydrolase family 31 protein n=1 Tax=Gramella jeungdoensis TaxID=708091 RepID=A0ABT0Z3B0_9FLAO|nr:glycoside hydrolase family 31 protein [Gramella jeungdoensis]MCM8569890.1 glycoside hydrolase family 31 protein [Gramella jeungdoensis]